MRRLPIPFAVLAVVALVVVVGIAFIHLNIRMSEAELRARAERLATQSADSFGQQLKDVITIVQLATVNGSAPNSASDLQALFNRTSSSLREGLVLYRISKGKVVASYPSAGNSDEFAGLPFDDWSENPNATRNIFLSQLSIDGPFRLPGGGWVITLRAPILFKSPAQSSTPDDWVVAALRLETLARSARLTQLPVDGFDYEVSYREQDGGRKRPILSSSFTALSEPLERDISYYQRVWILTIAPRDGWRPRKALAIQIALIFIFALVAAVLAYDLAKEPERLRGKLSKRDRRLQAANSKYIVEAQQRADLEKQSSHANFHDSLTGLPNRHYFMNRLQRAVVRTTRKSTFRIAVITVGFDRFDQIINTLGHAAGEELIVQAARRFENCLRPFDLAIASLSSNELAFLLFDIHTTEVADVAAERLQRSLVEPFDLNGSRTFVTASIGIAVSAKGCDTAEELIRGADIALSMAKADGGAKHKAFDPATQDQLVSSKQLENDLRRAIEQWEFVLNYQPIVSLETGRLVGMEVLVRWHHPLEGILAPGRFIPLAEETGLIVPLNRAIVRAACQQARVWLDTLPEKTDFYFSVNLTSYDFRQTDLCDSIAALLKETGLPRGVLRVEVTESSMISDVSVARGLVSSLHEMGVPLLLDDFGIGYSSLSYLHLFRFDYLKIDMAFVRRITPSGENLELIRAMVQMAEALGIETIAEGIEHAYMIKHLKSVGCKYGQGYYFSKPIQGEAMEKFLLSQNELNFLYEADPSLVSRR